MDKDLDRLEEALGYFAHAFTRPKAWEVIQQAARTTIDRPSTQLLHILSGHDTKGCKMHELAEKLGIEAPSVTRTVQQMEQDKLVQRVADPDDKRAVRLVPTKHGLAVYQRVRLAKRERLRVLLADWSPHERKQLARLLHRLANNAATYIPPTTKEKIKHA